MDKDFIISYDTMYDERDYRSLSEFDEDDEEIYSTYGDEDWAGEDIERWRD